jgi:hypothetical protein
VSGPKYQWLHVGLHARPPKFGPSAAITAKTATRPTIPAMMMMAQVTLNSVVLTPLARKSWFHVPV